MKGKETHLSFYHFCCPNKERDNQSVRLISEIFFLPSLSDSSFSPPVMRSQYKIFIFSSSNVTIGDTVEKISTVEDVEKLNQKKYAIKTLNGALEWTDSLRMDVANTLKTVLKRKNKNLCLSCYDSQSQGKSVVSERNCRR